MNIDDYSPSWQNDGLGIVGEQSNDDQDFNKEWDTNAWSRENDAGEDFVGGGGGGDCMSIAGTPPLDGTFVLGSIDGTCQWIDTTTCS